MLLWPDDFSICPGRGGGLGQLRPKPLFRVLNIIVWPHLRSSSYQTRDRGAIIILKLTGKIKLN